MNSKAMGFLVVFLAVLCSRAAAYAPHMPAHGGAHQIEELSRREVVNAAASLLGGAMFCCVGLMAPDQAGALEECRAKMNCIRTTWTPPSGTSREEAVRGLREAIISYPPRGQGGIDCNGWTIAADDLDKPPPSSARVEYKSCVGLAAVSVNLAQPFVDDLILEVDSTGVVQVRSSSRMGSSDLGVNKKRVGYIGEDLRARGWKIPAIEYGL